MTGADETFLYSDLFLYRTVAIQSDLWHGACRSPFSNQPLANFTRACDAPARPAPQGRRRTDMRQPEAEPVRF